MAPPSWPSSMRSALAALLTFALAVSPLTAMQAMGDALLDMGIAQFKGGELEAALFSLDKAVERLAGEPGRTRDLVRAYVYLGASYVGLSHDEAAKGKFRAALAVDRELRLSSEEFPARVLQVFETERLKVTAVRSRKGRRTALILGGVGAAAAVGVAVAASPGNLPPTAAISVAPTGQAIAGVTRLSFTAAANDPEGDPLTYAWDFGDGVTASGSAAEHVYASAGEFGVTLTVTDGHGGSASARVGATARTLSGTWGISGFAGLDDRSYQCVQTGPALDCPGPPRSDCGPDAERCNLSRWHGTLADPRRLVGTLEYDPRGGPARSGDTPRCVGEASSDLNTVRCIPDTGFTWTFVRR